MIAAPGDGGNERREMVFFAVSRLIVPSSRFFVKIVHRVHR